MSSSRRPDGLSRPTEALKRFGITDATVRRIPKGLVSWHWDVRTADERLVLRRYNPWRQGIEYEHRVLQHLGDAGWPVAAPITSEAGETQIDVDGCPYALFRFLPGRARTSASPGFASERGELLGRLHDALEPLVRLGQREGSAALHDYASQPLPPNGRSFAEALPGFARSHPKLGAALQAHHDRLARPLSELDGIPQTVVHGDFSKWNLLYRGRGLTGILDFDFTRLDLPMADVAISTRFEDGPAVWSAFVRGYITVRPVPGVDRDALVPLRMARGFAHAATALAFWETGRDDMLREIEIAVLELDRDRAGAATLQRTFEEAITT